MVSCAVSTVFRHVRSAQKEQYQQPQEGGESGAWVVVVVVVGRGRVEVGVEVEVERGGRGGERGREEEEGVMGKGGRVELRSSSNHLFPRLQPNTFLAANT